MSNDLYQRNLNALNRRDPALAARVFTGAEDEETILQQTPEGYPTVGVKRGNDVFFLHHPQEPLADAKRIITAVDGVNDHWNFIHLGMGLGYTALLLQNRQPDPPVGQILVERSLSVFRRACQTVDMVTLFQHPMNRFIVGEDTAGVYQACMSALMDLMANPPRLVKNNPSLNLDGPYYEASVVRIEEALRFGQSGLLSKQQDGFNYLKNLFANLKSIVESPGIKPMHGKMNGTPAVIVAAGPSLEKNLHHLKGTGSQWLIVAVDTALEKCLKNGIVPHFVCTVDPTELNRKHFPSPSYPEAVRLLFDPEGEPEIIKKFAGRCLTYHAMKHPFHGWLDAETGPKGLIDKGAMVSQAALLVCAYLGCRPIILIGQDLALDPQTGHTHFSDAALCLTAKYIENDRDHVLYPTIKNRDNSFKEKMFWVEGVNGEPVPTVQNLYAYLRLLERDIANTHAHVIDATEGGAKIAGTTIRRLADLVKEYEGNRFNVDEFYQKCCDGTPKRDIAQAREIAETLRRRLRQVRRIAQQGLAMLEPLRNSIPSDRDPQRLQRELDPLRQQIFSDPLNEYTIEQTAAATLFDFLKLGPANLGDPGARCREVIRRYDAAFQATVEASNALIPELEKVVESLRFSQAP